MAPATLILLALTCARASALAPPPVAKRAALIAQINSNPRNLWSAAAYSRFEGTSAKSLCGVDTAAYLQELRAKIQSGEVQVVRETLSAQDLPTDFDSATNPAWSACR